MFVKLEQKIEQLKDLKFKVGYKINKKANAVYGKIVGGVVAAIGINPMVAFASGDKSKMDTSTSDNIIDKASGLAFQMFKYVGFFLLVWGIGQLVMAYRNDDSDSKVRAIMAIAAGAALFGLQGFFDALGISITDKK